MPYKSGDIPIAGTEHDRRRKLTENDRQEIRRLRGEGWSQRRLAEAFGVSRRLIIFVIDPEKHEENIRRRKERGGSAQYYDRQKHREYIKNHRRYKQDLFVKGEISL